MGTFRDEVFEMAKLLSESEYSNKLRVMREEINAGKPKIGEKLNSKQLFFSTVKEEVTHFYGVLVLNGDIEKNEVNELFFKNSETFSNREKELYFQGHHLLIDIFSLLIKKLDFLPFSYRFALSPYAGLKEIDSDYKIQTNRIFQLEDYKNLADSFAQMNLVEDIRKKIKKVDKRLYSLNYQEVIIMLEKIKDEITKFGFRDTSPTMQEISLKRINGNLSKEDENLDFFYTLYCLKESIRTALNTFFSSLIGRKMSVINEDNIIKITDNFSASVKKGRIFLLIDDYINLDPNIGNISLMTYKERYTNKKIHDFGIINAIEIKFDHEFGNTIKISNLLIDDCLNMYYPYIN